MEITLTFILSEEVSPDFFAYRVANACAEQDALQPGEGVRLPSDETKVIRVKTPADIVKEMHGKG